MPPCAPLPLALAVVATLATLSGSDPESGGAALLACVGSVPACR